MKDTIWLIRFIIYMIVTVPFKAISLAISGIVWITAMFRIGALQVMLWLQWIDGASADERREVRDNCIKDIKNDYALVGMFIGRHI